MNDCGDEKYALDRKEFIKLMKQSDVATHIVARWFIEKGYEVEIKKLKIAPSWQERLKYSDEGDFYFWKNGDKKKRVEVKYWPKIDFKLITDVTYQNIIVNAVNSWDNANPKPSVHFILNKSKTHVMWINSNTSKYWFRDRKYDKRKNGKRTFYFCPREYVKCIGLYKPKTPEELFFKC